MSTEIIVAIIAAVGVIVAALIGIIRKKAEVSQTIKKGNRNIQISGNVSIRGGSKDGSKSAPND